MVKNKGDWPLSPWGNVGSDSPMMFACAMPREQFPWADEISCACVCIWQGQQC